MWTLPRGSVDLVLCDPPYGKTALRWDEQLDSDDMWTAYDRLCTGPVILMAMQPFTSMLIQSNLKDFRYTLVWDKGKGSNPLLANKRPMCGHEDIVVFYKRQPTYHPQMKPGIPYTSPHTGGNRTNRIAGTTSDRPGWKQATKDTSKRFPLSILKHSIHCGSKLHPTQKPVSLMEELILTYTNRGDTVLDNCMGSGTTGVACINTGRRFIGIEQDKRYFTVAKERIEAAQK
jgi:site-specific DNA-methyltransferase (adenine-specific)